MLDRLPFTFTALHEAYAAGTRPADVIDEIFARLDSVNDPGIFIHLCDREDLRAQADALGEYDPDMPLWGIPFAAKDNIDVAGIETTAGCPAYAYTPHADAFVIANLRAAGALMIGKTNLDQFATGLVGVRTPYGAPLNAVDPKIVPGGSSGGSGVIVGHGIVSFSLGTDTAGSGRVPAALNNIVGLKPTLGALSASGVVPACRSIETVSIFALTVDDAYAAFAVARGFDAADSYAKPLTHEPLTAPSKPLRVGVPDTASIEFFGDAVQQAAFDRDVALLKASGAEIDYISFEPLYAIARMLYEGAWVAERYTVIEDLLKQDPDAIHPVTRQIITHAESMSAADAFRGMYRLADLKRAAEPMLEGLDLLCVPTIPTIYSVADLEADPVTPNSNNGTYTNFVNLLDMCGIAVPTAPRSDGRPGSVTLLAGAGQDALAAAVARGFEADCTRNMGATAHPLPTPAALPEAESDQIELAVCGAHMTGLPLNGQLTDLGATFVRKAQTKAEYKFYALAGGPPARPGLVRSDAANAGSVAVEVWSLPKVGFGTFMAGIPAPLGIGTIALSDGASVKGFICEASGIKDATDITDLGDWRAYLAKDGGSRMTSQVEQRLSALGLELPPDWTPRGQFLPFRKDGSVVYLSGQICEWAGEVTHTGPVLDTPEALKSAREAAKICALNLIYRLREACDGDLDRVDAILRLGGFVNCTSGFPSSPLVINGATEVFIALFGEAGWHARTAVGVSGLPGNASVEVDAVVRLKN